MTRQAHQEPAWAHQTPSALSPYADASASRPTVLLVDGRAVSSWSPEWLSECRARHIASRIVLGLPDKPSRHAWMASYQTEQTRVARLAGLNPDPDACGAEARRRLEVVVLDSWHRSRAVA